MKKTYWWRITLLFVSILIVVWSFVYDIYICLPVSEGGCPFFVYRRYFLEPVAFFSMAFSVVSLFLFFVSNNIFKKWLGFAIVWLLIAFLWIANSPEYDSGFFSMMNFTKEKVSIFMSILFVPTSLGILFFASRKEKRSGD
jgi:hypothetical protein